MNTKFVFKDYSLNGDTLSFRYAYDIDGKTTEFCEQYKLPDAPKELTPLLESILKQLHIAVGVSYYKALLGTVSVPYELSPAEANYWNTVYTKGLSELMYVNKIEVFAPPFSASSNNSPPNPQPHDGAGFLLGVGGGKDSIVSSELLKSVDGSVATFEIATRDHRGQALPVMHKIGAPEVVLERYLDTAIVDFTNGHNGYHGHIPISSIIAWLGLFMAAATGKQYFLAANEAASSVGNTIWNGIEVNHQWSKSLEFEKLTQDFIRSNISTRLSYFSPIRPYTSLAVIALFAKLTPDYLPLFTSCNLVLRIDPAKRPNGRWCTTCAKCLSTWLLLSPWYEQPKLIEIFGRDMLADTELQPLLKNLLGLEGHKPLDCVGTTEELRAASRVILEKHPDLPIFAGISVEDIPGPELQELLHTKTEHAIPKEVFAQLDAFVEKTIYWTIE